MAKAEIIAEIGINHNGDMEIAKKLIGEAKSNGADVAKFQLFDPEIFCSGEESFYDDALQARLDHKQFLMLHDYCQELKIEFMASVFDTTGIAWCEEVNVKRYKIASRSIHDKELIQAIADTGKPTIASLGMYEGKGFPNLQTKETSFLYCVSKYPTAPEHLTFNDVDFNQYTGFSDHSIGITACQIALAKGARIIEKHFTLDKNMKGPDHICSMVPTELREIVEWNETILSYL